MKRAAALVLILVAIICVSSVRPENVSAAGSGAVQLSVDGCSVRTLDSYTIVIDRNAGNGSPNVRVTAYMPANLQGRGDLMDWAINATDKRKAVITVGDSAVVLSDAVCVYYKEGYDGHNYEKIVFVSPLLEKNHIAYRAGN